MKKLINYFSKFELSLWLFSVISIFISFYTFDKNNYLTLFTSLIGITSLIFNAKGNPLGQFLMVVFSLLYGIISYNFSYYGEMITYVFMTMPMAIFSLFSWLKNIDSGKNEVKVNTISATEIFFLTIITIIITIIFYYILKFFNTQNIIPSTVSISTSFVASYLTFRRSIFFSFFYALNDIILIILWILASITNIQYVQIVICFLIFLLNDIYAFLNWRKIKTHQEKQ